MFIYSRIKTANGVKLSVNSEAESEWRPIIKSFQ